MEYVKIGTLVDLKQGLAINKKSNHLIVNHKTNLSLLRIADMPERKKVIFMSEDTPKRFIANEDDIIFTRTGQVGLVFRNQYGVVHNNCFRVIPLDKNKLSKDYLYYVLNLKSIYKYVNNIAAGSAQPDLPHTSFKTTSIPYCDLKTQQKIADILSKYDDLIENNNKRIKLLEQTAQNLYKNVFSLSRIKKDSKLVKLEEIMKITRGISYSSEEIECEEGNDLINLKNIKSFGGFRLDGTKKYNGKYKQEQVVNTGDLVMGVTDMTQDRRTVGSVALIPILKNTSVISADLIKIESNIDNVYLYSMFRYGQISKHISQFANGANVLHLKPKSVLHTKTYLPKQNIIDYFVNIVKPIMKEIDLLNEQNQNLIKQRDLLLPRLMSGKLEV